MYNKNNLAVAKLATRNRIKPELACVAFCGNRTMATDTFRMIEVSAAGPKLNKPVLYFADDVKTVKLKKGDMVPTELLPIKGSEIDGETYPDLDRAKKSLEALEYAEIMVNAAYLEEILSVMKNIDPKFAKVTIKVPMNISYKPMVIEAVNLDPKAPQSATALLMPLNR